MGTKGKQRLMDEINCKPSFGDQKEVGLKKLVDVGLQAFLDVGVRMAVTTQLLISPFLV